MSPQKTITLTTPKYYFLNTERNEYAYLEYDLNLFANIWEMGIWNRGEKIKILTKKPDTPNEMGSYVGEKYVNFDLNFGHL